jgi:hypothetical protein
MLDGEWVRFPAFTSKNTRWILVEQVWKRGAYRVRYAALLTIVNVWAVAMYFYGAGQSIS